MKQLTFARPAALKFGNNFITDHNRSPITISNERFETKVRTQNAYLRKYHIADKRSFSVSWEMVPATSADTVDGGWGPEQVAAWLTANPDAFPLTLTYDNDDEEQYIVVLDDISVTMVKRWQSATFYDMTISLEEV